MWYSAREENRYIVETKAEHMAINAFKDKLIINQFYENCLSNVLLIHFAWTRQIRPCPHETEETVRRTWYAGTNSLISEPR